MVRRPRVTRCEKPVWSPEVDERMRFVIQLKDGETMVKCPRLLYRSQCESSVDFKFQRG